MLLCFNFWSVSRSLIDCICGGGISLFFIPDCNVKHIHFDGLDLLVVILSPDGYSLGRAKVAFPDNHPRLVPDPGMDLLRVELEELGNEYRGWSGYDFPDVLCLRVDYEAIYLHHLLIFPFL